MPMIERHCPECGFGTLLVARTNSKTGVPFLGCPRWPRCTYTEGMPEAVKMRLAGAPTLPGME